MFSSSFVMNLPVVSLPYPKNRRRLSALEKEVHAEHARYMFALMEEKREPFETEQHFNRRKEQHRIQRHQKLISLRQRKERKRQTAQIFTNVGTWTDFAAGISSSENGNRCSDSEGSMSPIPSQKRKHIFNNVGTWADFASGMSSSSDSGNGSCSDSEGHVSPLPPQMTIGFAMPQLLDPDVSRIIVPFSQRPF